jgi:hypothetical protein
VVIAPGGKVVYRRTGEADQKELLSKLFEALGPYYENN